MAVAAEKAAQKMVALTGNEAVALAMKQINPDVVAAYPITPQTDIVQYFSSFVADGAVKTEFVPVESEHSAMSAAQSASAAGCRAMTATSSQGLALMWEVVYITASYRLPVVMPVVNRALSAPINIHCDHSDTMGARDSGWIQLYSENAQEAYDNMFQALRIAEHPDVLLPVMVMQDGFIVSHAMENLEILDDATVAKFIGEYHPKTALLDFEHPISIGPLDLQDYYFEHRRQQAAAMERAKPVILEVAKEYAKISGREYGLFEAYRMDDAEVATIFLNSAAGTAKDVVDELRGKGVKAGMLKLRVFRPFPMQELQQALCHCKAVAVMDRADSFNAMGGPMFGEVRCALYDCAQKPQLVNYIYGLGGRDIGYDDIRGVYNDLAQIAQKGRYDRLTTYLGVRE